MKYIVKKSIEVALELSVVVIGSSVTEHFFMNNIPKGQFGSIFMCGGLTAIAMLWLIEVFEKSDKNKKS